MWYSYRNVVRSIKYIFGFFKKKQTMCTFFRPGKFFLKIEKKILYLFRYLEIQSSGRKDELRIHYWPQSSSSHLDVEVYFFEIIVQNIFYFSFLKSKYSYFFCNSFFILRCHYINFKF